MKLSGFFSKSIVVAEEPDWNVPVVNQAGMGVAPEIRKAKASPAPEKKESDLPEKMAGAARSLKDMVGSDVKVKLPEDAAKGLSMKMARNASMGRTGRGLGSAMARWGHMKNDTTTGTVPKEMKPTPIKLSMDEMVSGYEDEGPSVMPVSQNDPEFHFNAPPPNCCQGCGRVIDRVCHPCASKMAGMCPQCQSPLYKRPGLGSQYCAACGWQPMVAPLLTEM